MTHTTVNDGGVRDPYTKAVERFVELLQSAFPRSSERDSLIELVADCMCSRGLFYRKSSAINKHLRQALAIASSAKVPARDRIMLSALYKDCERYEILMTPEIVVAQGFVEKIYSQSVSEERALLASLANARDDIFETRAQAASKNLNSAIFQILNTRRLSSRHSPELLRDFTKTSELSS